MKKSFALLLSLLSTVSVASAMNEAEVQQHTSASLTLTEERPEDGRVIQPQDKLAYEEVCRGTQDVWFPRHVEIVDWLFNAWKASGKGEPVVNDPISAPLPIAFSCPEDGELKDERAVHIQMWENLGRDIEHLNAVHRARLRGDLPTIDSPEDIRASVINNMVSKHTAPRFFGTDGVLRDLALQVYHDGFWHHMFEARLKTIEDVVSELIADGNPHLTSLTPQERYARINAFFEFSGDFLEIMSGDANNIKEGISDILRYPVEEIKSRGRAFEWFQANRHLRFPQYSSYGYSSFREDNSISSAPRRRLATLLLCLPASKIEAYCVALAAQQDIKLEPALLYEKRPFIEKLDSRAALDILHRVLFASEE